MMRLEFDLAKIRSVSHKLIRKFKHKVILFEGGIGAGKTTLISSICKLWEVSDSINSPTFSIVNEYISPKVGVIYHIDLYRLNSLTEFFDSGIEEYFDKGSFFFDRKSWRFLQNNPSFIP